MTGISGRNLEGIHQIDDYDKCFHFKLQSHSPKGCIVCSGLEDLAQPVLTLGTCFVSQDEVIRSVLDQHI